MNPQSLYRIKTAKVSFAVGRPVAGGRFVVFANSRAAKTITPGLETASNVDGAKIRRHREELIDLGVLVDDGKGHLRFTSDFDFKSCHLAAAIINGRPSANGFNDWKALV